MVKHLGINITKYVQNMYAKNCKKMEEIKKDLNIWKATPCSWTGKTNMVNILNTANTFNALPIKIPGFSF